MIIIAVQGMSNIMVPLDVFRHFCEPEKNHETSQIRLFPLRDLKLAPSEYKPNLCQLVETFFRVIHIKCDSCHRSMAHFQVADGRNGFRIWRVAVNASFKQSPADTM